MTKVVSVGFELEVSKGRSTKLVSPQGYYTSRWVETTNITEFRMKPVRLKNERNTVRRLLCNLLTGGVCKSRSDVDILFQGYKLAVEKNYEGTYTPKGESGHLHIKVRNDSGSNRLNCDGEDKLIKVLKTIIPLFARRSSFRSTITNRAYPTDAMVVDSKSKSWCYNSGVNTYEIRINESLIFPLIASIIIKAAVENGFEGFPMITDSDFNTVRSRIVNAYRINRNERAIMKPILKEVLEYTDAFIRENADEFSARGRYYRAVIDIVKSNLRYYVSAPKKFEIMCAGDMLTTFYERDRRFKSYVDDIYVPFYNEVIEGGNERASIPNGSILNV